MRSLSSQTRTTGDPTFEVYLWPAGDNEALLLKTPGDRWGIIDCGLANPNPKLRNPPKLYTTIDELKEFLRQRGVTRLAFAQLTHPEKDQAKGMYELLEDFELDLFFVVGGSLKRSLLANLARLLENRVRAGQTQIVEATPGKVMWAEPPHDFRLIGLGPSSRDRAAFGLAALRKKRGGNEKALEEAIGREIESNLKAGTGGEINLGPLIEELERTGTAGGSNRPPSYNRLSIITLAVFGQTRVLFGGDALAPGWRELARSPVYAVQRQRQSMGDPRAHAFKVPHHGAIDAMPLELVPTFVHRGAASLISSSGHGFSSPAREVLEGLTRLERGPYCTGRSAWCPGQPIGRSCCGLIRLELGADGGITVEMEKAGRLNHPVMCLFEAEKQKTTKKYNAL